MIASTCAPVMPRESTAGSWYVSDLPPAHDWIKQLFILRTAVGQGALQAASQACCRNRRLSHSPSCNRWTPVQRTAGGHQHKAVAPAERSLHNVALPAAEGGVAKHLRYERARRTHGLVSDWRTEWSDRDCCQKKMQKRSEPECRGVSARACISD